MATKTKSTSRTTLVNGCGTILKTNRLKHGYTLVKRKKAIGTATATAPAKRKAGRPKKVVATVTATATAPKRKAGRPAKAKMVATVTAPKRKAGRPKKVMATAMKPSVPATTKRRGKRKSRRTVKA